MPSSVTSDVVDVLTVRYPDPSAPAPPPAENAGDQSVLAQTRRVEVNRAAADLRKSDPDAAERYEAAMTAMPSAGDIFLKFRLVQELGRGAFGRVFLARQLDLADRLVALKIAADLHGESQRLARLQHTNIVPIYSEHRLGDLYAVCMPYCGSTTFADICKSFGSQHSLPTSGRQLVSTLVNRHSTIDSTSGIHSHRSSVDSTSSDGTKEGVRAAAAPVVAGASASLLNLEQMTYVEAVLWMAARLADGLAHAHERGIIHRDLKPANILLCDDGQPMLLDFNLADDVHSPGSLAVAQMGGTLPYMSPEQLQAYADNKGRIDARGDIYSLGLVLYHLLTGRHAFPVRRGRSRDILPQMMIDRQGPPLRLRPLNRSITPAIEAIVQHCLEPDPARRYADARGLADDLERQRANLPLKHLREPSLVERLSKWARRNPRLASPTSLTFVSAALMLLIVAGSVQRSLRKQAHELDLRREYALTRYHDFQNRALVTQHLLTTEDPTHVSQGLEQGQMLLTDYRVIDQADWMNAPLVSDLAPSDQARLKADVGAVAFLMARAVHTQADGDDERALRMNELAQQNLDPGSQPAIVQQRAAMQRRELDPEERARLRQLLENAAGLNARGRFLLACDRAAQGQYRESLGIIDGVVVEDPNDFGAWSLKGRCHQMLDQEAEAIAAYGTAIALRPTYARTYVYRAAVLFTQQTRARQALQDLDQAIKHQPALVEARIDRALVLFSMSKFKESLADLDVALQSKAVPSRIWFVRARVRKSLGDLPGSQRDLQQGFAIEPGDALSWVARGYARLPDEPQAALADFIKGEACNPRCMDAYNNQAYVYAVKLKQPLEAIAALDRLLVHFPENQRALGYRAILKARAGKSKEAIEEARELVKCNPPPEHLYRAACALALASDGKAEVKTESLRLLAVALQRGWGYELIATDKDLDPIRDMLEFKQLAGLTKLMRSWTTTPAGKN